MTPAEGPAAGRRPGMLWGSPSKGVPMGGNWTLSRAGREVADEIAACHWEIELARSVDGRDREEGAEP